MSPKGSVIPIGRPNQLAFERVARQLVDRDYNRAVDEFPEFALLPPEES